MRNSLPKSKSKNNLKKESIAKKVFRKKKHSKEKPIFAKSVHDNQMDLEEDASFITESTRQNNMLKNMKLMRQMINSQETQNQNIYQEQIETLQEENRILRDKLIEMERNAQMAESQLDLQLQLQNQSIPRSTDIDNVEFLLQEEKLMNQIKEQDLVKQKEQLQEYNAKIEQENLFLKSQNKNLENENKILLNQNSQFKQDLKLWKDKCQKNFKYNQQQKNNSKKEQIEIENLKNQNKESENKLNLLQDKYEELVKNSKSVDSQLVFLTNALNSLLNTQFQYKLITPPVRETYKKLQSFGEQILQIQEKLQHKKYQKKISQPQLIFKSQIKKKKEIQKEENDLSFLQFNNIKINKKKKINPEDLPQVTLSNISQFCKQKSSNIQQDLSPTLQPIVNEITTNNDIKALQLRVKRIEEYLEITTDYKKKASFLNVFESS